MAECQSCGATLSGSGACEYCGTSPSQQAAPVNSTPQYSGGSAASRYSNRPEYSRYRNIPGDPLYSNGPDDPRYRNMQSDPLRPNDPRYPYRPGDPRYRSQDIPRVVPSGSIPTHGIKKGERNRSRVHGNVVYGEAGPIQTTIALLFPKLYRKLAETFGWGIHGRMPQRYSIGALIALLIFILVLIIAVVVLVIWLVNRFTAG